MMSNRELLRQSDNPGSDIREEIRDRLARWYAERRGFFKDKGNWIHKRDGKVICHGWGQLYDRIKGKPLFDELERWEGRSNGPCVHCGEPITRHGRFARCPEGATQFESKEERTS